MEFDYLLVRDDGDVTVVTFTETNLESESVVQSVGDSLYALVDRGRTKLVLDFSKVRFAISTMLGKLIGLNRRISAQHGHLAISGLSPYMQTVVETSRLDHLFPIYHDEDQAIEAIRAAEGSAPPKPTQHPTS